MLIVIWIPFCSITIMVYQKRNSERMQESKAINSSSKMMIGSVLWTLYSSNKLYSIIYMYSIAPSLQCEIKYILSNKSIKWIMNNGEFCQWHTESQLNSSNAGLNEDYIIYWQCCRNIQHHIPFQTDNKAIQTFFACIHFHSICQLWILWTN